MVEIENGVPVPDWVVRTEDYDGKKVFWVSPDTYAEIIDAVGGLAFVRYDPDIYKDGYDNIVAFDIILANEEKTTEQERMRVIINLLEETVLARGVEIKEMKVELKVLKQRHSACKCNEDGRNIFMPEAE